MDIWIAVLLVLFTLLIAALAVVRVGTAIWHFLYPILEYRDRKRLQRHRAQQEEIERIHRLARQYNLPEVRDE